MREKAPGSSEPGALPKRRGFAHRKWRQPNKMNYWDKTCPHDLPGARAQVCSYRQVLGLLGCTPSDRNTVPLVKGLINWIFQNCA